MIEITAREAEIINKAVRDMVKLGVHSAQFGRTIRLATRTGQLSSQHAGWIGHLFSYPSAGCMVVVDMPFATRSEVAALAAKLIP